MEFSGQFIFSAEMVNRHQSSFPRAYESARLDFAGHDEVFDNIDSAIAFIEHAVNP
jgi:hypothetical protein